MAEMRRPRTAGSELWPMAMRHERRDHGARAELQAGTAADGARPIGEFLIARGGPFYDLQLRLGLLREQALHAGRRAAILVGLAWGVPLLLSALAGHAIGPAASRPFLLDLGAWARFVIAIGIFVLMERLVEERLRVHLGQFVRAPLLAPAAMPAAAAAVVRALRRRDARLAELVCVVAAYAITLAGVELVLVAGDVLLARHRRPRGARSSPPPAGGARWSAARCSGSCCCAGCGGMRSGASCCAISRGSSCAWSRPIPDGAGGLAFIGQYPERVRRLRVRARLRARRRDRAHAAAGRAHGGRLRPADGRLAGGRGDPVRRPAAGVHRDR